ncbi:MAG: c-type cytochrome [bacterium]
MKVVALLVLVLGLVPACDRLFRASSDSSAPDVRRGERLYNQYCLSCHGGPTGGSMMDYPPRHNARGHTWHHPDCQLREIIKNGGDEMTAMMRRMMAPPNAPTMPAFRDVLTDEDVDSILAFIKGWWTAEQRDFQAQVTQSRC